MNKIITQNWVRITKKQAEKRYKHKMELYVLPCKMNPENAWIKPMLFDDYTDNNDIGFQNTVDSYIYYNCNNELGYYLAFYITRKEYDEIIKF